MSSKVWAALCFALRSRVGGGTSINFTSEILGYLLFHGEQSVGQAEEVYYPFTFTYSPNCSYFLLSEELLAQMFLEFMGNYFRQ